MRKLNKNIINISRGDLSMNYKNKTFFLSNTGRRGKEEQTRINNCKKRRRRITRNIHDVETVFQLVTCRSVIN